MTGEAGRACFATVELVNRRALVRLGTGLWRVIGAHYDSVAGWPGANDNATGVAALLELSRVCARSRSVRFVAFVNKEPPFLQAPRMGRRVYARACRERATTSG